MSDFRNNTTKSSASNFDDIEFAVADNSAEDMPSKDCIDMKKLEPIAENFTEVELENEGGFADFFMEHLREIDAFEKSQKKFERAKLELPGRRNNIN